jgi:leucyl aminopeptidase
VALIKEALSMFEPVIPAAQAQNPRPVHGVTPAELDRLLTAQSGAWPTARALAGIAGFTGKSGQLLALPAEGGGVEAVLFGLGDAADDPMSCRALAAKLPAGDYLFAEGFGGFDAALAFALGAYRFDRYRKRPEAEERPRLVAPSGIDLERVRAIAHACALARDMINTPANDLGPHQIETIAREIASSFGADFSCVAGESLLEAGYPAVHAVGRAAHASRAPRMIELTWGDPAHPTLALVGKGVVFDTGGLDIKPSAGMRLMKKDMGGAAHALALGRMVMALKIPVRLVVLIPAVENAISGDAMRPGDVLQSRKGLTIEVGNTDAEGRLILADALARAAELAPDLTLDLATLTGAARAAVGPQIVPFWTSDDQLAADIAAAGTQQADPMWRLPLWAGYEPSLDSDIADLKNDPDAWAQAGSITAALFLQRFAPTTGAWAHFDIFGWNPRTGPGRPVGAETQAIRALLSVIEARYA